MVAMHLYHWQVRQALAQGVQIFWLDAVTPFIFV